MFSFSLTNLSRKVLWLALAVFFSVLVMFQLFGAVVKRMTGSTGSASCASVRTSSKNDYQEYATMSVSAEMAAVAPKRNLVATAEEDGTIELVSDVLLYPGNIILAKGHPVVISDTVIGNEVKTKVWIDENNSGSEDSGEVIVESASFMSSVYLYGGSEEIPVSCESISITMKGGEIGAIFAGGYYQNVSVEKVDIKILGGSVHYVDCGSQAGPLHEKLTASESISILLKDCVYRSNFPISGISSNSYACKNVSVQDYSTHRDVQSYTRQKPIFNHYVVPIENKRYVMGGNVTIPSDMTVDANVLVLEENALVNNLGKVTLPRCSYLFMFDGASWTGNKVSTSHSAMSFDHYTYSNHYHTCSECGTQVCDGHIWVYVKGSNGTHTKQCSVCGYGYTESCEKVPEYYDNQVIVRTICKQCKTTSTSRLVTSVGSSTCKHTTITTVSIPHHHVDSRAEGMIEYDITHQACRCASCLQLLPFTLTYRNVNHYFKSLSDVSHYFKANSIISGTVRMNCDAFAMSSVTDTINIDGSITLDMCGCDMHRTMHIQSGTVNIINSMYGDGHYSHFKNYVNTKSGTVVNAKDCHFYRLVAGNSSYATFILNNVRCDQLFLYGKENITLNSQLVVERYMYNYLTANNAPSGYVIGEMKSDGTWSVLYDHTATNVPMYLGPEKVRISDPTTSYIALMPCMDHKLTSVTSYRTSGHTGVCLYCDKQVEVPHVMTSGKKYSTKQLCHQIKCSECGYTNGIANHDFDKTGKCLVCGDQAYVSIRGSHSPKERFLLNFDEALTLALHGLTTVDTISLYSNQTNTKAQRYTYDRFTITGIGEVGGGPRIFIEGNGYTLDNTGSMTFPTQMIADVDENGHHYYSFETSSDIKYAYSLYKDSQGNTMLRPMVGYRANIDAYASGYVIPEACNHMKEGRNPVSSRLVSPVLMEGHPLNYHVNACSQCLDGVYYEHTFVNGVCSNPRCGVSQSDVAVVRVQGTYAGSHYNKYFSSLYKAWEWAEPLLWRNANFTIQILDDIDMYQEHSASAWSIKLQNYPGTLTIDATDDNGEEHSIKGWYNSSAGTYSDCIIDLTETQYATCTIKSGIFQGYRYAVKANRADHLILEGGTFKNGMAGSSYAGLYNSSGIMNNLPAGYYVQYGSNIYSKALQPNRTVVSGTVKICSHANAVKYEELSATCTTEGHEACVCCQICGWHILSKTGQLQTNFPSISGTGHAIVNSVCARCGLYINGLTVTQYSAGGDVRNTLSNSYFSKVWTTMSSWGAAAEDDYFVIKLAGNVNLLSTEEIPNIGNCKNVIIDLNGHNLNLGTARLNCGDQDIKITDSSRSGKSVLTGAVWQNNLMTSVTLDGVVLHTSTFKCANLIMTQGAGLVLDGGIDDSANIRLMNLSMENGCYMEGVGCSKFNMYGIEDTSGAYDIDKDEAIADLAHNMKMEQQNSNGDWISIAGSGKFKVVTLTESANPISIETAAGKSAVNCYRWHAEKKDVEHTLTGRYCSVCELNTQHYLLHDQNPYTEQFSRQYKGVSYERNFATADVWEPLYIPMTIAPGDFAADCDVADIYMFGRVCDTNGDGNLDDKDDTWLIVDLMTSSETDPNYPYLIRAKQSGTLLLNSESDYLYRNRESVNSCSTAQTTYSFKGVHHEADLSGMSNMFVMNEGKLKATNASVSTVAPQRWYVEATTSQSGYNSSELRQALSSGIRVMVIGEDMSEETALQLLRGETVEVNLDGQRYTLDGRKATHTQSGIQVLNGKTIMIK